MDSCIQFVKWECVIEVPGMREVDLLQAYPERPFVESSKRYTLALKNLSGISMQDEALGLAEIDAGSGLDSCFDQQIIFHQTSERLQVHLLLTSRTIKNLH